MPPRAAPNRGDHRGARGGQPPFASGGRRGGAGRRGRPGSPTQATPIQATPAAPSDIEANRGGSPNPGGRRRGAGRGGQPRTPSGQETPSQGTLSVQESGGQSFARGSRGRGVGRGQGSTNSPGQATPSLSVQPFTSNRGRGRRGGRGNARGEVIPLPDPALIREDLQTICVKRPNYGTAGRKFNLEVNSFELIASDNDISHYDAVLPDNLSYKRKLVLFQHLQNEYPDIFTPKMVYDGQKMAYCTQPLNLGPTNAGQFDISFPRTAGSELSRPPRVFNIKLTKVATISTEILRRFINGQQSWDEQVQTALMALNIAIRTEPNLNNPYRGRSFYNEADRHVIGGGLEVWRGIFQSVRPAIGRLVVNIDLSATIMYQEGPLIGVINEFFQKSSATPPTYLTPGRNDFLSRYDMVRLRRFLNGLRISIRTTGPRPRTITGLTGNGADSEFFDYREGQSISVANYFAQLNFSLQYPGAICVKVGKDATVPLEMCHVLKGQFANKVDMGPQQVAQVLQFATKIPTERMASIKGGIEHLQFTQSDYISQFGLELKKEPLKIEARIIDPPRMRYSDRGPQATLEPRSGSWNMLDKQFLIPGKIRAWAVAVYDYRAKNQLQDIIKNFQDACAFVGVQFEKEQPVVNHLNPQGNIASQLQSLGQECYKKLKEVPSLIIVILPEGAGDLYVSVKKFGNITHGIVTQCVRAKKCSRAKPAYWANVMLKVNVKLGGINTIPESNILDLMSDPANPTIVIGADVMHPAPSAANGRPSITAVVGSVDANMAKYTGITCVQQGRVEMISDLKDMCKFVLENYKGYRKDIEQKIDGEVLNPKRLLFYRDGVSEGEFNTVKEQELPLIRQACLELGMDPKITLIVVRKRHHNQMFPVNPRDSDRSGNAPAGTVIDRGIAHPTEFDFFLQSHAGILGTSRPGFYSVLHDEFGFNADSIQSLSFALCHVYAPATRSVSIPAPVYYADKMCANSKINFDDTVPSTDAASQSSGEGVITLEAYKTLFRPAHQNQQTRMYFVIDSGLAVQSPSKDQI